MYVSFFHESLFQALLEYIHITALPSGLYFNTQKVEHSMQIISVDIILGA